MEKYFQQDWIARDHTHGKSMSSNLLTGWKKNKFSEEKTGIKWCKGSPNILAPAYRLRMIDYKLVLSFQYSEFVISSRKFLNN